MRYLTELKEKYNEEDLLELLKFEKANAKHFEENEIIRETRRHLMLDTMYKHFIQDTEEKDILSYSNFLDILILSIEEAITDKELEDFDNLEEIYN